MTTAIVMVILLLVFIMLGLPISFTLLVAVLGASVVGDVDFFITIQRMFAYNNSFSLLAIPLFFVAGELMLVGGISKRIVDFAYSLFGWFKGCFAVISFVACAFFGAISGSSFATTAAIGSIMYPKMVEDGYKPSLAAAIQATGGTLGTLIPPAILCVIYAQLAGCSAGDMFITIAYVGIAATVLYSMATLAVLRFDKTAYMQKAAEKQRFRLKAVIESGKGAIWALLSPIIILGGIYCGVFTPSECAVVATVYSLIVGFFVYRELTVKKACKAIVNAILGSAAIMFILNAGNPFSYILTKSGIPNVLTEFVTSTITQKLLFLLAVNVLLLLGGMFMDTSCLLTIMTPLLCPMLGTYDINVLHFGAICVLNMTLGTLSPPFGGGVFVAAGVTNQPVTEIFRSNMPLLLSGIAILMGVTYVPLLWL